MHAPPSQQICSVLCAVVYVVHVSGSLAPNTTDIRACLLSPAEGVRLCVHLRMCARLGHKGHLRHKKHTYAWAHTLTHVTLCSSSVSSTREMEGTKPRWITDLGDRRASPAASKLLCSLPPDLHDLSMTPSRLFSPPHIFMLFFYYFYSHIFCPREILCRNTFEMKWLYKKKDSGLNFIEQQS